MGHGAKMPPSKIKLAFASSKSSTKDDDMAQDDMGDVGGNQVTLKHGLSSMDSARITDCGDSSSLVINSYENDSTSGEMKRKKETDDWKLREEDDEEKSEEWWPELLDMTNEPSPEETQTAKCSTPGQFTNICGGKNTRRCLTDGCVQTVSHPSQEICQDSAEMETQEDDNNQIISNCHPIPVIQPAFVCRTSDSERYQSTQGESFSTVHNNVNIPVQLQCSTEDSLLTDKSEVENVSHKEDNYSAVPLVNSSTYKEASQQGLVTNPPPCQPASTVYNYAFLNLINEGTYGVVYKAMHKTTGDVVAIKMLKSENQPQGVSGTGLREVNIMSKARHINVISLREVVYGNNIDKVYLVMEYAETDLKQLMYNLQRPFSVSETKGLLVQLLYAVQYLHDKDILHRDIKTENLLLNLHGILKVTDFGLARTFSKGDKHLSPVVVTLWYRAPELLLGSKTYSTPVDLWSVGCVFAELLTGNPFWDGESEIDQLHQIFCDLGTPSEKIWPGYSRLPFLKTCILPDFPYNRLRRRLGWTLTELGLHLLNWFLTYSPARRVTAVQALQHWYFQEVPLPLDPQFLAAQVFSSPLIHPQCFVQGSGEPQPTMVYSYPTNNINYTHG